MPVPGTLGFEDGSVLTYTYDSRDAGRLVSVAVTGGGAATPPLAGTTAQTFTYDGPGHRLASTDNNDPATGADDADCAWLYDSLGRTIEESQQLGATGSPAVVSYQYTANDRAALVYPNGREVGYTYHTPGGPLHAISDLDANGNPVAGPPIAQYDYLGGRTLVRAMQNGVHLDLRDGQGGAYFDTSGRPTKWLHLRYPVNPVNPVLIGFEYAYDAAGNKQYQKSVHDPLDSQRYAYDSADRLTACVRGPFGALPEGFCGPSTGTWSGMDQYEGWNLDGLGNWQEYTTRKAGPTTATATTTVESRTDDTFNAYANVGGVAQSHDLNGNMTNDGKKVLKWDAFNRLREVWTTTGTLVAKYTYDTIGRRLQKTIQPGFPGESATFRFADWRILEDCTTATPPAPKRQYTYGNYLDEFLSLDINLDADGSCIGANDSRLFYHQNDLFSVYGLTNSDGEVVEGYEYDPYGAHIVLVDGSDADSLVNFDGTDQRRDSFAPSPSGNSRSFTGKPYDRESGLHWYGTRQYSAWLGQFTSADHAGYAGGIALREYVASRPSVLVDPRGLWGEDVHRGKTNEWAESGGFKSSAAGEIAAADQGMDTALGTNPYFDRSIGKHLNTGGTGDADSRVVAWMDEWGQAVRALEKSKCTEAAKAFGRGLHSIQDMSAHRNFPGGKPWPKPWFGGEVRIHPAWWDYYGDGRMTAESDPGSVPGESKQWLGPGDYSAWAGPTDKDEMARSQNEKIQQVKADTDGRVSNFVELLRRVWWCKCGKELLK